MQFFIMFILAAFAAVPAVAKAIVNIRAYGEPGKMPAVLAIQLSETSVLGPTNKAALHNCLAGYRNRNWSGVICGVSGS